MTAHNGYPTTFPDLAQYIVCVMSAIAQSDTLQGFHKQMPLLFEFLSYYTNNISNTTQYEEKHA
jgi:hypothetical protein